MSDPVAIGRYRVESLLGAGGFSTVWLAHDDALASPVAIKVLADNWSQNLDVRDRFLEEARILRRADSDRLVRVYDIAETDDGRPYFVMAFADRGTLADRIAGHPRGMARDEAISLLGEIARAVNVLHRMGVVHRDLKPRNILFVSVPRHQRDGDAGGGMANERLLVADLGLAKALATASRLTLAAGSPTYCAPEQTVVSAGIDVRADVYALGVMAFELLTGHTPTAAGIELAAPDRCSAVEAAVRAACPEAATGAADAIGRAIELDPDGRFADVDSFVEALTATRSTGGADKERPGGGDGASGGASAEPFDGRPLVATPSQPRDQNCTSDTAQGNKRRRAMFAAVGVAAAIAVVVALVAVLADRPEPSSTPRVSSADGKVSVEVPRRWAADVRGNGWSLDDFGRPGRRGSGVTASADFDRWRDPTVATPGVFVGASDELADGPVSEDFLDDRQHAECATSERRKVKIGTLCGYDERWTGCPKSITWDEVVLAPAGAKTLVYVQVKEASEADRRDLTAILESIQVAH